MYLYLDLHIPISASGSTPISTYVSISKFTPGSTTESTSTSGSTTGSTTCR